MTSPQENSHFPRSSSKPWQIGLWTAQVLLAALYIVPGVLKTSMAPAALASMGIAWATDVPIWFLRFIGLCELAGALGLILPALTRIKPQLTFIAAACLILLQVLAIGFHAIRGETAQVLPMNIMYLALAVFVYWGRTQKLPIQPRD